MVTIQISEAEYLEADESGGGWCLACGEMSGGFCEPDARKYLCGVCGAHEVYGAAECLVMGKVEFTDDE